MKIVIDCKDCTKEIDDDEVCRKCVGLPFKVVKKAKELTNQEIYLVLGGFHLETASESQISSFIQEFKDLGVQNMCPCHCSGDRSRQMFQAEFGNRYIEAGVGKTITINGA